MMVSKNTSSPLEPSSTRESNDELILKALTTLEDPVTRKKLKLTAGSICILTGLSINTVRSRDWALVKLRSLKLAAKQRGPATDANEQPSDASHEVPTVDALRLRIRKLLEQNALLFEEIQSLRAQIKKRDEAIVVLQGKRLTAI